MNYRDSYSEDSFSERWRLHLRSPPRLVHRLLSTNDGRARFWAESAKENNGIIEFKFIDGLSLTGKILENKPPARFVLEYWGRSRVTFELEDDGTGGTDLTLIDHKDSKKFRAETFAGWLSVLLALKAAADFSVDLRNHDKE